VTSWGTLVWENGEVRRPDKTRYLNAMRLIEQGEVPFVETEADFTIVEKVLGRSVWPARKSYDLAPGDYVEFVERLGMDMAYLAVTWRLGRRERLDECGRRLYVDGTIKTRHDLKRIEDPGDDDIRRRLDEMLPALEGTGIGTIYNHWNTPATVSTAMGYQDYYVALIEDPDFVREFFRRVDEILVRRLEVVLEYPVDAHIVYANLAMSSGQIVSDDLLEEFEMPYLERNVRMIRARGLPVSFHCDGDCRKFFPRLIEMGIGGIQAIDPCGGRQDIFELKRLYGGRLALHGNVDCGLLISGTPEQVAAAVREQIEKLAPGGGYICSSSHDLNELMPLENIWALARTIHEARVPTASAAVREPTATGEAGSRKEPGAT